MKYKDQALRLRAARLTAGYQTSLAFCKQFRVPNSTYSQHESGKYALKDSVAKQYAEYLNVNFEWLKYGRGEAVDPQDSTRSGKIIDALHEDDLVKSILERRSAICPIDESLLTALVTALHYYSDSRTQKLTYEQIGAATAGLYIHLSKVDDDLELRDKMIKLAIGTYFHSSDQKSN